MSNPMRPGEHALPWAEPVEEKSHKRLNTAGRIAILTFLANLVCLAAMAGGPWSWLKVCAEGLAIQDSAIEGLPMMLGLAGFVPTVIGGWIAVLVSGSRPLKTIAGGLTISSLILLCLFLARVRAGLAH